jgi:hypothetical protein
MGAGCGLTRAIMTPQGESLGALIMLGTLFGLVAFVYALVLQYDPEARGPSNNEGAQ